MIQLSVFFEGFLCLDPKKLVRTVDPAGFRAFDLDRSEPRTMIGRRESGVFQPFAQPAGETPGSGFPKL